MPEGEHPTTPNLLRPVMPELDSIRGIAILLVVFYHGLYINLNETRLPHFALIVFKLFWIGRLGVSLFFVLSGFLITGILVDSKGRPDYYSRFYARRAFRILPAYFITIVILVVFGIAPWKFIGMSLLYLSNLTPLFGIPIAYSVLWSLAVEEHFYFLWPIVVRNLKPLQVTKCCVIILALSPLSRLLSFYLTTQDRLTAFRCNEYTWNSLDGLACGALFAIWLRSHNPSRKILQRAVLILFISATAIEVIGLPWGIFTRQSPFGAAFQVVPWHLLFVTILGSFLLLATSNWKGLVSLKFLRFFGEISYGLYLYHMLAYAAVDYLAKRASISWTDTVWSYLTRFVVGAALAIGFAYFSRRTVEDYFLGLKQRLTRA